MTNPDSSAAATRIHFSRIETERGYDFVYVRDANNNQIDQFAGDYPSGVWSSMVSGRTVKVQLTTDGSVTAWGFCVDRIETVPGRLQVVETLSLSPANPQVGQTVMARFKVKNVGGQAMTLRRLLAGGHGPNCTDWACNSSADFPVVETITLQPNEEYLYSRQRSFAQAGSGYFAEPVYQDTDGNWRGIPGANRVVFSVR